MIGTTQFPLVNQLTIIFTLYFIYIYNYLNYLHGHYWGYTPFSDTHLRHRGTWIRPSCPSCRPIVIREGLKLFGPISYGKGPSMAQGLHAEWAQCPTAPGGGGTHDTSRRSGWMGQGCSLSSPVGGTVIEVLRLQ